MNGKLLIARHHESEWNRQGRWTGSVDVGLSEYGFEMSRKMGHLIKDFPIEKAFASTQIRSLETLLCMEDGVCIDVPIERSEALNERDYGVFTGKNKWDVEKEIGTEEFEKMRRTFDYPIPNGETLRKVYERVVPFYLNTIMPLLTQGKTILLVAHGNSLRTLIKYLEKVPDNKMSEVSMPFGAVIVYDTDDEGRMLKKEIRSIDSYVPA